MASIAPSSLKSLRAQRIAHLLMDAAEQPNTILKLESTESFEEGCLATTEISVKILTSKGVQG